MNDGSLLQSQNANHLGSLIQAVLAARRYQERKQALSLVLSGLRHSLAGISSILKMIDGSSGQLSPRIRRHAVRGLFQLFRDPKCQLRRLVTVHSSVSIEVSLSVVKLAFGDVDPFVRLYARSIVDIAWGMGPVLSLLNDREFRQYQERQDFPVRAPSEQVTVPAPTPSVVIRPLNGPPDSKRGAPIPVQIPVITKKLAATIPGSAKPAGDNSRTIGDAVGNIVVRGKGLDRPDPVAVARKPSLPEPVQAAHSPPKPSKPAKQPKQPKQPPPPPLPPPPPPPRAPQEDFPGYDAEDIRYLRAAFAKVGTSLVPSSRAPELDGIKKKKKKKKKKKNNVDDDDGGGKLDGKKKKKKKKRSEMGRVAEDEAGRLGGSGERVGDFGQSGPSGTNTPRRSPQDIPPPGSLKLKIKLR